MRPLFSRLGRLVAPARNFLRHTLGPIIPTGFIPTSNVKVATTLAAAAVTSVGVFHDFTTKKQKRAQHGTIKLIQTMRDHYPPEADPEHSNQGVHQSHLLTKPAKYADNEIFCLRKVFAEAIDDDGILDIEKAGETPFWKGIVKDGGINLQKLIDVQGDGKVPFLAFAYSLIVAEALSLTYETFDRKAMESFQGTHKDWRVPVINTIGLKVAHPVDRVSDLSHSNPKRFSKFLFKLCDRNADGVLDKPEVKAFVRASRILGTLPDYMYFYGLDDDEVTNTIFERWDLDENGVLDQTEFLILNKSFQYDHLYAATAYQREYGFQDPEQRAQLLLG